MAETEQDTAAAYGKIIAKAWRDPAFKAKLLAVVHRAGELDERAIAGQLDQAAAMAREDRLESLFAMLLQAGQRAVFVPAHQARVAHDIRSKDGR